MKHELLSSRNSPIKSDKFDVIKDEITTNSILPVMFFLLISFITVINKKKVKVDF